MGQTCAIRIDNLSKRYRLGELGSGALSIDLERRFAKWFGRPDRWRSVDSPEPLPVTVETNAATYAGTTEAQRYHWALRDVSLDIQQGEIVGIIGRNGAGKSTLLKILSRVTAPTKGRVMVRGTMASLLEVGTGFHPELTGLENIFLNGAILGMTKQDIASQLDEIVAFSGCERFIDTPVKRYSSGMAVRLGFAVAAHLKSEILVVDEVLAVGDASFQKKCVGRIQAASGEGRTVLFVSHNMGTVSELCTRCVLLQDGAVKFDGDVDAGVHLYLDSGSVNETRFEVDREKDFQFMRISTSDANREARAVFGFDESIQVGFSYRLRHSLKGLEIGLRVVSTTGTIVFTTLRSHSLGDEERDGVHFESVEIPAGFLLPGSYSLDLGAHIPNQRMLDNRESVLSFQVTDTGSPYSQYAGTRFGMVHCPCRWTKHDRSPVDQP